MGGRRRCQPRVGAHGAVLKVALRSRKILRKDSGSAIEIALPIVWPHPRIRTPRSSGFGQDAAMCMPSTLPRERGALQCKRVADLQAAHICTTSAGRLLHCACIANAVLRSGGSQALSVIYLRVLQVLPQMGAMVPEDITLVPCSLTHGTLLARVYKDATLRGAWLAAEAAFARSSIRELAIQEELWVTPAAVGGGSGDVDDATHGGGAAQSALLQQLQVALGHTFRRGLWVADLGARYVAVDTILGAAVDVRPRVCLACVHCS